MSEGRRQVWYAWNGSLWLTKAAAYNAMMNLRCLNSLLMCAMAILLDLNLHAMILFLECVFLLKIFVIQKNSIYLTDINKIKDLQSRHRLACVKFNCSHSKMQFQQNLKWKVGQTFAFPISFKKRLFWNWKVTIVSWISKNLWWSSWKRTIQNSYVSENHVYVTLRWRYGVSPLSHKFQHSNANLFRFMCYTFRFKLFLVLDHGRSSSSSSHSL